ncbi:vanin-like protein 1 [Uranotaenia lowii]|uniref:vanin-like protein 1 n=1 Tax=Uranotaenia lowii TaxID=190385 RepID=UPI002479E3A5|nr:vanin-like protein 1 [Uranotaenia lowii]
MVKEILIIICFSVAISVQQSDPNADHYWAGVVEFSIEDRSVKTPAEYTAEALDRYKRIINSVDANPVDIIVFPEYGLNTIETASFVPSPSDNLAPCNHLMYDPIVRDLSCIARQRQKYLVVNLIETSHCPESYDWRDCAEDGLYRFNTNVVFDRDGFVIARYRKSNLYGERGVNVTHSHETVTFDTDFGVRMGLITSFDILFGQPAASLGQLTDVTDIVFPAEWFSGLPFLTAAQLQQGWAYRHNVNLLAAGISSPEAGSTGTGVYAGRRGRIVSVMNYQAEEKLYIAQVPKIDRPSATISRHPVIKYTPAQMSKLALLRDQIDSYEYADLPRVSNANFNQTLCQKDICCNFTADYTFTNPQQGQKFYRYRLAVASGMRRFGESAGESVVKVCTILACTGDALSSCGTHFDDATNLVNTVRFNSIEIEGTFQGETFDFMLLPSTLDSSILPLEVDEFDFNIEDDGSNHQRTNLKMTKPRSDLYTFGIWGREYSFFVSKGIPIVVSYFLITVSVLLKILF